MCRVVWELAQELLAESYQEAYQEGYRLGCEEVHRNFVHYAKTMNISKDVVCKALGISVTEFLRLQNASAA